MTKSTVVDAILSPSSKNRRREDDSDGNNEEEKDGDGAELTSGARTLKPFLNVWEWEDPETLEIIISVILFFPPAFKSLLY